MTRITTPRPLLSIAALVAAGLLAGCSGPTATSSAPVTPEPPATPSAVPNTTPSVEPTVEPTTAPSVEPSPSEAAGPTRFDVPLTIATDHVVTAGVVDWTGQVIGATSGTPGDGASVEFDAVQLTNDGPTTLVVTWVGGPCDATPSVVWDADSATITVIQEPCQGDAIAFDRIVRLDLSQPVDAASVTGVLQPGGDTLGG